MNPNILALDQFPPCTTSLHCNETSQFNTQNYMYVITKICSCTLQDNRATFTLALLWNCFCIPVNLSKLLFGRISSLSTWPRGRCRLLKKDVFPREIHIHKKKKLLNPLFYDFDAFVNRYVFVLIFQSCNNHDGECVLARDIPRLLPQLPARARRTNGGGQYASSVQTRLAAMDRELRLGLLVLQDARLWLHVYGISTSEAGLYAALLEVHILPWTCRHRFVSLNRNVVQEKTTHKCGYQ